MTTQTQYRTKIIVRPETSRIQGNASAWDEETDRNVEEAILTRLENGEVWAWASVEVQVHDDEGNMESDFLGCCSYEDEADFRENSGYFNDMVWNCIEQLETKETKA